MRTALNILCLSSLLLSPVVTAKESAQFGAAFNLSFLEVNDPEGSTETAGTIEFINPVATFPAFSRDTRWWVSALYSKYEFKASPNEIGQDVEHMSLQGIIQTRFRISRYIKPWVGVGLGLNNDDFTKRHKVDDQGFLLSAYDNRSETSASFIINASNEWEIDKHFSIGLTAQFEAALADNLQGFRIGTVLFYQ